jgi:hypothetical protein
MAPVFLAQVDIATGAGTSDQLYWSKSGWFSGTYAEGPTPSAGEDEDENNISSFEVLDELIGHYADKNIYPNMEVGLIWISDIFFY